jgi:hypothetical protein
MRSLPVNTLRRYRRAGMIVGSATVIDLSVRAALNLDMGHIIPVEAAVFLVTAALLVWASRKDSTDSPSAVRADLWLAAAFALAGIRLALLGSRRPGVRYNLTVLALGIILGARLLVRHRLKQQ